MRKKIKEHNLKSGEIIFEYDRDNKTQDPQTSVENFFEKYNIKTEESHPIVSEVTKEEAIASILYGLSTKLNYTVIDKEFTQADKNEIVHLFMQLFTQPTYYTLSCRLYQTSIDINDCRETG